MSGTPDNDGPSLFVRLGLHAVAPAGVEYIEWLADLKKPELVAICYDLTPRTATDLAKRSRGWLISQILQAGYVSRRFIQTRGVRA